MYWGSDPHDIVRDIAMGIIYIYIHGNIIPKLIQLGFSKLFPQIAGRYRFLILKGQVFDGELCSLAKVLYRLLCRLAKSGKDAAKSSVQAAVGVVRLLLTVWWQRECGGEVWQRCCAGCGAGCCPKSGGQGAVQATVHTAVEKSGKGAVQGAVQAAVHIARALGCNGLC